MGIRLNAPVVWFMVLLANVGQAACLNDLRRAAQNKEFAQHRRIVCGSQRQKTQPLIYRRYYMDNSFARSFRRVGLFAMISLLFTAGLFAQELGPGKVTDLIFSDITLPPTLHAMLTGETTAPTMTVRLPDDYDSSKAYPLLVYVPGFDGGLKGNIGNAQRIAGPRGWIVASLPLFKKTVDKTEPGGGILVSIEDGPIIAQSYEIMLRRLFSLVPHIDRERSAMVGFSNGAITIAVLVSSHDEFILDRFRNFCVVDHGMFHLMDLHKNGSRDCRFLVLVGDKQDFGRELKIRQSQLLQDEMRLLRVNLSYEIMKNTGHEFGDRQMAIVGQWLRNQTPSDSSAHEHVGSQGR